MALDPQARAWLERAAAAGVRPYPELGVEGARRLLDANAVELFGVVEDVAEIVDVDADGVPARLYRPVPDSLGALVWLHGGGWVIGSLESHDPLCRALAARTRCAVLAVDYRLAPEHPYPAGLEDAWAATRWAASEFPRIAVGGDSAGAHLAAVVAQRARRNGLRLLLQVLVVPVTDCSFDTASYTENAVGYGLERATMVWFWNHFLSGLDGADDPEVSPLRAPDLTGLAPALVLTAEHDPLRDEGEAYAARLREAGVPVEHSRYEGMVHGFIRMPGAIDRSADAIEQIARRVREALAAP